MSSARHLVDAVTSTSLPLVEVYTKKGRSRSARLELGEGSSQSRQECAWAVRAGNGDESFFVAGTGRAPSARELLRRSPIAGGKGLTLPPIIESPVLVTTGGDVSLVGESESMRFLSTVADRLEQEVAGSELVLAELDDGYAEISIESSRGLSVEHRARVASIRLWARLGTCDVRVETAERQARGVSAGALARRLADRLSLASASGSAEPGRGPVLLSPEVAASILSALERLFVGAAAWPSMVRLLGAEGQGCSSAISIVDDGRLAGGLLEAPVDGEGVPTRRVVLVDQGRPLQPLLPWRQPEGGTTSGCCQRPSWRQPPLLGATHLYIEGASGQPATALLAAMGRGYYFVDVLGSARLDLEADRFAIRVCGFEIERGRPKRSIRSARLGGSLSDLFGTIEAVGTDLRFVTGRGCWGSPSLLITGLAVS